MDVRKMIADLQAERERITLVIAHLTPLAQGQKRRGRPPAYLSQVKRRGRPPGSKNRRKEGAATA